MKKIKSISFLLSLTSCLCLFGVGFSMWYNVSVRYPQQDKRTGSIESYDVLEIANTEMTIFKFSMLSFKADTTFEDVDSGKISVTYTVSPATLETTRGTFRVDTSLGYVKETLHVSENDTEFKGLFDGLSIGEENLPDTVSIKCEAKNSNGELVNEGELVTVDAEDTTPAHKLLPSEIKSAYKFDGVSANNDDGSYSFTITYTFNIPNDNGNFAKKFGKYLQGADIAGKTVTKFAASAYVTKIS